MAGIWKAEQEVVQSMKDLVMKHHPSLIIMVEEIAVVFKEKASMVGDVSITGKTAKASPMLGILGDTSWKFIITLAADVWKKMDDKERIALLDHHLCACGVKEDEESGELKTYIKVPDVQFFKDEVERNGFWRTTGNAPDAETVTELFG